uniref:p360-2L n=1 Tax=African swine fever virus TaxID=10497 RepID=A0A6G7KT22_ASF
MISRPPYYFRDNFLYLIIFLHLYFFIKALFFSGSVVFIVTREAFVLYYSLYVIISAIISLFFCFAISMLSSKALPPISIQKNKLLLYNFFTAVSIARLLSAPITKQYKIVTKLLSLIQARYIISSIFISTFFICSCRSDTLLQESPHITRQSLQCLYRCYKYWMASVRLYCIAILYQYLLTISLYVISFIIQLFGIFSTKQQIIIFNPSIFWKRGLLHISLWHTILLLLLLLRCILYNICTISISFKIFAPISRQKFQVCSVLSVFMLQVLSAPHSVYSSITSYLFSCTAFIIARFISIPSLQIAVFIINCLFSLLQSMFGAPCHHKPQYFKIQYCSLHMCCVASTFLSRACRDDGNHIFFFAKCFKF